MFAIRYRYLFIVLLGAYSAVNILYTGGDKLFDFPVPFWILLLVITIIVLGIWEFNRLIESYLLFPNLFKPRQIHPLIVFFLISLVNVVLVCAAVLLVIHPLLDMNLQFNVSHLKLLLAFGFRVNLFLHCLNAIVYYMNRLKQTQLEAEVLKKISIEARFEVLRGQINPHFLFNCFNVLSTLVYKDADMSAKFISQLSNVYRYLLFNQEKKVVTLEDELSFLESYLFLIKIRFGENIEIENRITPTSVVWYIAPAVLQMLIENAIKHNIISKRKPLKISIVTEGAFIEVTNNLQVKEVPEESSQVGLKNIQSRYLFLTNEAVIIQKTATQFKVKIPLLELEK